MVKFTRTPGPYAPVSKGKGIKNKQERFASSKETKRTYEEAMHIGYTELLFYSETGPLNWKEIFLCNFMV